MARIYYRNGTGNFIEIPGIKGDKGDPGPQGIPGTMPADLNDYIKSQGTSGIWTYRKWNNGVSECWGRKDCGTVPVTNAWGTVYESTSYYSTIPSIFIDTPNVFACGSTSAGGIMSLESEGHATTTQTQNFYFTRPSSGSFPTGYIDFYCIGRWK